MWVTPDGVAHTAALPHPEQLLSPHALASWDGLLARAEPDAIRQLFTEVEERLFGDGSPRLTPDGDDRFVGEVPPPGTIDGDISTVDALRSVLAAVSDRWVLDIALALEDMLDREDDDD